MSRTHSSFDVVVVGAGFGGLAAALRLAEAGARVALCERLSYPGGCASTFERAGYRFEAGATLFSGFGEGQLFRRWIDAHRLAVEIAWLDPVVEFRTPGWSLDVPGDRDRYVDRLAALPGAPRAALESFFAEQRAVADALWDVLDDPALVPPLGAGGLLRHLRRLPRYVPLARLLGRSLGAVLRRHGLGDFEPLTTLLDAQAQITVQCGLEEAEAPFALATLDYYFRGTGHVRGGIGVLASELVRAIRALGGDVFLANEVRAVRRVNRELQVETRKRRLTATDVVLNVLPTAAARLLGGHAGASPRLAVLDERVRTGWGACMLYLVVRAPDGAAAAPRHVEIVQDPDAPCLEGNHLFCSISGADDVGRAPPGRRTITVSTHVPMGWLLALGEDRRSAYVAGVQERMRTGLRTFLPDWMASVEYEAPASPRTFERFTGRPDGFVGGIPRRVGLGQYADLLPAPLLPGVHLVGDSVFPGQSALATALGGLKRAEAILRARALPGL